MSPPIFVSLYLHGVKIPQIFAIHFAERKKILQKLAQKQTKRIYDNRKYLRDILQIAKISVNISNIFCKSQKIPLKIPQKKRKKLMAPICLSLCAVIM